MAKSLVLEFKTTKLFGVFILIVHSLRGMIFEEPLLCTTCNFTNKCATPNLLILWLFNASKNSQAMTQLQGNAFRQIQHITGCECFGHDIPLDRTANNTDGLGNGGKSRSLVEHQLNSRHTHARTHGATASNEKELSPSRNQGRWGAMRGEQQQRCM